MNWRIGISLYLLGLVVYSIPAYFQSSPGYMDAEYYYSVAVQLKEGMGFNEMIIWNFLDDPAGLPHPSNGYWMPLPSILAWIGMVMTSSTEFVKSRIIFYTPGGFRSSTYSGSCVPHHAQKILSHPGWIDCGHSRVLPAVPGHNRCFCN